MNAPQLSDFKNSNQMGRLHVQKHWPEFYKWILEKYKEYPQTKFSAYLYMYFNHMSEPRRCPVCGKYTPFLDYKRGFQNYCSSKCSNSSQDVIKKKEETSIKNWGTKVPSKSQTIKNKVISTYIKNNGGMGNASKKVQEKFKETMREKYGVESALQNKDIYNRMQAKNKEQYGYDYYQQRPDIKEKIRNTMVERYGGVFTASETIKEKVQKTNLKKYGDVIPNRTPVVKEKIRQTCLDKYGVEYYTQTRELRNITKERLRQWRKENRPDIIDVIDEHNYKYACPHPECDKCIDKCFISDPYTYHNRTQCKSELCTVLNPIGSQVSSIELFVKNVLDKHNIPYEEHNREVLDGLELDFYISSKQIAIECNGIYWHDSNHKPKDYHFNKWKSCREKGIRLVSIWEDWVIKHPELVEDIILKNVGEFGVINRYEIKEVKKEDCDEFLNKYHLYGTTKYSKCIGIYKNDELIGVTCVIKRRNRWLVTRYCTKPGMVVAMGLSESLRYLNVKQSDYFLSNDMGWDLPFAHTIQKQHGWYIDNNYNRHHISSFNETRKENLGIGENFNKYFLTVYDSGVTKYTLNVC